MASTLECSSTPLSPANPFYALHFHFGMLLGGEDFETEQAYHRGKTRLHNAWLHGSGVVWGYGVSADTGSGELRVDRGLALDPAGHELYLDARSCLSLAAWFEQHRDDEDFELVDDADNVKRFDAHVVARFRPCLTREVPALSEPCEDATTDTAFSRVAETVELLLIPGLPPTRPVAAYHRVRLFLGIDQPDLDENGAVVERDRAVIDAHGEIAAMPLPEQPAACLDAFRRFAALDSIDLGPGPGEEASRLFPSDGNETVLLAQLTGITLELRDAAWVVTGVTTVDPTVRTTLLPTSAIQALLSRPAGAPPIDAGGPRVSWVEVIADDTVVLTLDRALLPGSVTPDAFDVAYRPTDDPFAPWTMLEMAAGRP